MRAHPCSPLFLSDARPTGEPPDNAAHFVRALDDLRDGALAGLRYAVFGCGNHDWVHTFQRVPRLVDDALRRAGGEALLERGEADAGGERFFEAFEEWEDRLWTALAKVRWILVSLGLHYSAVQGVPR